MTASGPDLDAAVAAYEAYFAGLTHDNVTDLRNLATADMRFRDPFNDVQGIDKVIRLLQMSFEDTEGLRFEFFDRAVSGQICYYRWRCLFTPKRMPKSGIWTFDGMSEVAFDPQGRVVSHIDHWDASTQFYARLPVVGGIIRLLRRRLAVD